MRRPQKTFRRRSTFPAACALLLGLLTGATSLAGANRPSEEAGMDTTGANLRITEVRFESIRWGRNAVRVRVQNRTGQNQPLGVDIRIESVVGNWQRQFQRTTQADTTEWMTFDFEVPGPLAAAGFIRLRFFNVASHTDFRRETCLAERKYGSGELDLHEDLRGPGGPVSEAEKNAITTVFGAFQGHIRRQDYTSAWEILSQRMQSVFRNDVQKFGQQVAPENAGALLLNLTVDSVTRAGPLLTLNAHYETTTIYIHFAQKNGQWRIYHIHAHRGDWRKRLLPTMEKRATAHFDIHYAKGSTAERQIDQIARRREQGFDRICAFLDTESDTRICLVLFEDGQTKQRLTGHQGAGWAVGDTIVEVYNEQEKLDPYHETVHILMRPFGNPPALFNEGFAVYMSERLGAHALASLGGGQAGVHRRARELKTKGEWIELSELLRFHEIGSTASRPAVAYAEAASFVKFLIETYGKDKFLRAYGTLRNSQDPSVHEENARQLEAIYGRPLETLEQQWVHALPGS